MKKQILKSALMAVVGIGLLAGSAMALTYGSIPGNATNDLLGPGNTASGWYGANLVSLEDQTLTFTFLGKEAGYTNAFQTFSNDTWSTIFTTSSAVGTTGNLPVLANEIIKFRFLANGDPNTAATNGSNPDDSNGFVNVNFFTTNTPYYTLSEGMWGLWFDDGGAGNDDNHDDMLVGLTGQVNIVPEPATMLLFGTGIAGLAAIGRRRKKS